MRIRATLRPAIAPAISDGIRSRHWASPQPLTNGNELPVTENSDRGGRVLLGKTDNRAVTQPILALKCEDTIRSFLSSNRRCTMTVPTFWCLGGNSPCKNQSTLQPAPILQPNLLETRRTGEVGSSLQKDAISEPESSSNQTYGRGLEKAPL